MNEQQLKNIIEAALMASGTPQNLNQLLALFDNDLEKPDRELVRRLVEQLQQDYAERGVELKEVSSGYRFQVRSDYADWTNRLFTERPQRYSRAFLETLAIIAYRQPITRNEIEDIRGVSVSSTIIKTLQEREWVRVVGHRDVPGKPELLATTREFLDYFNLKKLSELPPLSEIKDFDQINPDLFEGLDPVPVAAADTIPAESDQEQDATPADQEHPLQADSRQDDDEFDEAEDEEADEDESEDDDDSDEDDDPDEDEDQDEDDDPDDDHDDFEDEDEEDEDEDEAAPPDNVVPFSG